MRINKFLAKATGLSRRTADAAIKAGRVQINQTQADVGDDVVADDRVALDGRIVGPSRESLTILLNKPAGYVCSRKGQGSRTVYDLLPAEYHGLKPVGRLDKDSSGLLLMTNDGDLANQLTHPRYLKAKIYQVRLDKPLEPLHQQMINDHGIQLEDGPSRLTLQKLNNTGQDWQIIMTEGRNRQIRRTFAALGYAVDALHRTNFGPYSLQSLKSGQTTIINSTKTY